MACAVSSVLVALVLLIIHVRPAIAQAGGHTLFGDFKVDETNVDEVLPLTFEIALYTEGGTLIDRQTVTNNTRYRFLNVANGRYDLRVEVEGSEVARIRVWVQSAYKTDFRQDVHLEWRARTPYRQRAKSQTVSASDLYDRPGHNKSLFEKAQRLLDDGEDRKAASLLNKVVESDPRDFQAWTELGTAYLIGGNAGKAEKAYRRAIQEKPTFALALLNLGRILVKQKRYVESIDPLRAATEARPDSAEAHFLLGEAYLKVRQGSKGVPHLNEALRLDPQGKTEAHLLLAALYNAAGLKDRAATEYARFLAKIPDYYDRKNLEHYISEHKKP